MDVSSRPVAVMATTWAGATSANANRKKTKSTASTFLPLMFFLMAQIMPSGVTFSHPSAGEVVAVTHPPEEGTPLADSRQTLSHLSSLPRFSGPV